MGFFCCTIPPPPPLPLQRQQKYINKLCGKKKNNGSDNSEQYLNILFRNGEI